MPQLRVGTSGWSYPDWVGPFYPPGAKAADFLSLYARRFNIVEVDSTYYAIPTVRTVRGWFGKTPEGFRFAVKAPSAITHDKQLLDCAAERDQFLEAMAPLGDKLLVVLLQFGYFNRKAFSGSRAFLDRLEAFLEGWPRGIPVAVEIRNKNWLGPDYFALLRRRRAAAALAEQLWMPPLETILEKYDVRTGDLLYLRLIGDRKAIEAITTTWDRVVIDRTDRYRAIANALRGIIKDTDVVTFVNNHFAGHGPAGCADFLAAMEAAAQFAG